MKIKYINILFLHLLLSIHANGQSDKNVTSQARLLRLMFYNVENLFDTENDSLTNDDEFTPDGMRNWTKSRYWEKLHHISSVIAAIGEWNPPEIIGLCEIENRKVLEDLCFKSGLANFNYKIIHKESLDPRGIDVAMLYRSKQLKPLIYKAIKIDFPFNGTLRTRDILYVKAQARNGDTLHVYINHWPSRAGGQIETERNRLHVSSILRNELDSIFKISKYSKIIIMGDLNDYPENKSVCKILEARTNFDSINPSQLYNLSHIILLNTKTGSHKFEGEWGILDQIIVSGSLLLANEGLFTRKENAHIFSADFLLEDDDLYSGKKLYRTYNGYKYHGGYSDHLPVFIDLENKIPEKDGQN